MFCDSVLPHKLIRVGVDDQIYLFGKLRVFVINPCFSIYSQMAVSAGPHLDICKSESATEKFRYYLESNGVMDKLTSLLAELKCIPESERPRNPYIWMSEKMWYMRSDSVDNKALQDQLTQLRIENLELKEKLFKLGGVSEHAEQIIDEAV